MNLRGDVIYPRSTGRAFLRAMLWVVLLIISISVLYWVLYRPLVKWAMIPVATRAPWVETLATSRRHILPRRALPPFDQMDDLRRSTLEPLIRTSNEQKRRLLSVYLSDKGSYGLAWRYSTVEGEVICTWLLAEDGKLSFVRDHTREGGAPANAVKVFPVKSVSLGFSRDEEFIEGEPSATDSPMLVFSLDIGREDAVWF